MHLRLGAVFVVVFALGGGLTAVTTPAHAAGHTPTCLNRTATIVGTPGNDTLRGTSKSDVIVGLGGHDSITGGGGSDYICAGGGRDLIDAGDGIDSLSGGAGDDRLVARQADPDLPDEFYADPGADVYIEKGTVPDDPSETPAIFYTDAPRGIHADLAKGSIHGWGHDIVRFPLGATIYGTAHDDTLLGSRYGDNLHGARGDDHLDGRGGPDYVTDDHGHDVLDGGAGRTSCSPPSATVLASSEAAQGTTGSPLWSRARAGARWWSRVVPATTSSSVVCPTMRVSTSTPDPAMTASA